MGTRVYRAVFALVGWLALALQYGLTLTGNPDRGAGELTLNFVSYFTVLTNILVALALTGPALSPDSRMGRWSRSEGVRAAVAMYIAVVGLTYHFLLADVWDPQGWALIANILLHYVMPIAFVLDWLLFTPKGRLRWIDPVKWLSFPALYTLWTLIHGYASGWWPYWFMNVPALGLAKAGFWAAAMLAFFLIVGLIVVAIDRTFARRDRRPVSA
ncbi:MAG: hypothetical protein EON91_02975 [Brevundimonas sp.]|uniref:Pr6Pr family membrane protein n=1 Tax=Brevundimonas sp. TaxID=1871086 RepID=UPI0011F5E1C4|nr:Pr6Pr family membrane protein [Brevundimonas sp.]RZJ19000.1 MAG: hypothetical protein EON91_02975 [Brevundimonas sp.]